MKFKALLLAIFMLAACAGRTDPPVEPPIIPPIPLTVEARLQSHGLTCDDITAHADGEKPSCERIGAAILRGYDRFLHVYPDSAHIRLSYIYFYRASQVWHPTKPYPLMISSKGELVRGEFVPSLQPPAGYGYVVMVSYSYEEIAEHEAVHALTWMVDPAKYINSCHGVPGDPHWIDGFPMEDPYNISPFTPQRCADVEPSRTIIPQP